MSMLWCVHVLTFSVSTYQSNSLVKACFHKENSIYRTAAMTDVIKHFLCDSREKGLKKASAWNFQGVNIFWCPQKGSKMKCQRLNISLGRYKSVAKISVRKPFFLNLYCYTNHIFKTEMWPKILLFQKSIFVYTLW